MPEMVYKEKRFGTSTMANVAENWETLYRSDRAMKPPKKIYTQFFNDNNTWSASLERLSDNDTDYVRGDLARHAPFNGLSVAEAERLYLLAEELGEAVQAIGKILRHGYSSYHPYDPMRRSNRQALEKEMADIHAATALLRAARDLNGGNMEAEALKKIDKVRRDLHHQRPLKGAAVALGGQNAKPDASNP